MRLMKVVNYGGNLNVLLCSAEIKALRNGNSLAGTEYCEVEGVERETGAIKLASYRKNEVCRVSQMIVSEQDDTIFYNLGPEFWDIALAQSALDELEGKKQITRRIPFRGKDLEVHVSD